jgi:hypothetical protein
VLSLPSVVLVIENLALEMLIVFIHATDPILLREWGQRCWLLVSVAFIIEDRLELRPEGPGSGNCHLFVVGHGRVFLYDLSERQGIICGVHTQGVCVVTGAGGFLDLPRKAECQSDVEEH